MSTLTYYGPGRFITPLAKLVQVLIGSEAQVVNYFCSVYMQRRWQQSTRVFTVPGVGVVTKIKLDHPMVLQMIQLLFAVIFEKLFGKNYSQI